jgi:D-2-hydroxyacid dehydrogenase (NADP+)
MAAVGFWGLWGRGVQLPRIGPLEDGASGASHRQKEVTVVNVLIVLTLPEKIRMRYFTHLRETFPEVKVDMVDHHSKVGPYIGTTDILMGFSGMMADHVFQEGVNLKWVQGLGTGMDGIIDQPSLRPEVLVTNMRGVHGAPVSEAAMLAMLALSRDLPRAIRNQGLHRWDRHLPSLLKDKTVGIFGVGIIAEELAPKCKAFGMTVVGITSGVRSVPGFDRMYPSDRLLEAVGELDFLVLLTPYSAETHGIIGAAVLGAMKPTAFLVNLGRGGLVDDPALIEALRQGQIAGAALDAFNKEPLPEDHPFWGIENIMITPKQGGFCDVYPDMALPIVEENMRRFLAGDTGNMINVINR